MKLYSPRERAEFSALGVSNRTVKRLGVLRRRVSRARMQMDLCADYRKSYIAEDVDALAWAICRIFELDLGLSLEQAQAFLAADFESYVENYNKRQAERVAVAAEG